MYVYVVFLLGGAGQIVPLGAWETFGAAEEWVGSRSDMTIAAVPMVRSVEQQAPAKEG
jgi:hypothetical protein